MWYDIETDTYTPQFAEEIQPVVFDPKLIPGINDNQINQDISIEI